MRTWPPARFKAFARRAVERGADVFHGHSTHLFQGVEAPATISLSARAGLD